MQSGPIERFKINGLYGYKDVEIRFPGSVLILIAGNGSGKTTILNALHAFLRGRFHRLRALEFESIECKFSSIEKTVTLSKSQIVSRDPAVSERLSAIVEMVGISEDQISEFVLDIYDPDLGSQSFSSHPVMRRIYEQSPWNYSQIDEQLQDIRSFIGNELTDEIRLLREEISMAISGIEIVYLPTYRRIENPMLSPRGRRRRRGGLVHPRMIRKQNSAQEPDQINYGLDDVEERLAELSDEAERIANWEYRSASATIIDDALAKQTVTGDSAPADLPLPDIDSLVRFLARVSRADAVTRFEIPSEEADESSRRRIDAIVELYNTGRINHRDLSLLRYFLSRLNPVIEKTKETEATLQRFVEACNGYLTSSSDEKKFVYEPNSMRVTVVNNFTKQIVPMSQLSSGETQVISLLARLYLYPKRNLILVDEPELSLSLDWQRKIIPDMMKSGSVEQLLAITHSPFIFDNEYDPVAGTMVVNRRDGVTK